MPVSLDQLEQFLAKERAINVRIAAVRGSSPRDAGAWMLVSENAMLGTIGGGQLEYIMIDEARRMLRDEVDHLELDVPLGPEIGQCCGGLVKIELSAVRKTEPIFNRLQNEIAAQPDVLIFGAGHVGKALVLAMSLLPVNPILIDQRANELPQLDGVQTRHSVLPERDVRTAKPGSAVMILTHDHALDFLIAGEALQRNDLAYVGMIGSKTKRAVFKNWLRENEPVETSIDNLICPIGGTQVKDKRPEVIAALVAAEIIWALDARQNDKNQVWGEAHA